MTMAILFHGNEAHSLRVSGADKKLPSGGEGQLSVLAYLVWKHSLHLYSYEVGFCLLKGSIWHEVSTSQRSPEILAAYLFWTR